MLALLGQQPLRGRVDALVRGESVHRLVLGVGLAPADVARQLRASVGLADREGLLVRSVAPESPADRGGVKAGETIGATDDLGYNITEDPIHIHDLHATIMHLMGFDHTKLTFRHQGRDFRLTDVHGEVVSKLMA